MGRENPFDFGHTKYDCHHRNKRDIGIGVIGIFPFLAGLLSLGRSLSPNAVLISSLRTWGIVAIGIGVLIMVVGYLED